MFQQRERESDLGRNATKRKALMYRILSHYMTQPGMSQETLRTIWSEAKTHRLRIDHDAKL